MAETQRMEPADVTLPFFAYGIFRPGQLAFFQIQEFVERAKRVSVAGELRLRDGLPIIDPAKPGSVKGALLTFSTKGSARAYGRIGDMEPRKQYRWLAPKESRTAGGVSANVLIGKSPKKGSVLSEQEEWDGWCDPLFTTALAVVDEALLLDEDGEQESPTNLKPLFRLQMAYLLLWSAIERYVSLRYHLGGGAVTSTVRKLAGEGPFAEALKDHVNVVRSVQSAEDPTGQPVRLDRTTKRSSIDYYYQVRSNIVHRGKAVQQESVHIRSSLQELLPIFRRVLKAAERDAKSIEGLLLD